MYIFVACFIGWLSMIALITFGWVLNLLALIDMNWALLSALHFARILGVPFFPLGSIMGWFV